MARNNIKLLKPKELELLNEKFIFELEEDAIVVKLRNYGRVTRHPIDKPFHINAKGIRKVCFSMEAINIWKALYNKGLPTLFSVQQAVNYLTIAFQKVDENAVKKILSGQQIKVKKI